MNRIANVEPSIFAFTGRPLDRDAGLQATPNRRFDESVGRWLDIEPVGFYQGDADKHRYAVYQPE
jgi:hypothetical protein